MAGNVGTFSASVGWAGAEMLIGVSSTVALVMKAAETMLSTTIATAKPQVAFSRKSVVLRTPMIWLDEAKLDARPPPFDSWIRTIPHINTDARSTSTIINEYIFMSCYLLFLFLDVDACPHRAEHLAQSCYCFVPFRMISSKLICAAKLELFFGLFKEILRNISKAC